MAQMMPAPRGTLAFATPALFASASPSIAPPSQIARPVVVVPDAIEAEVGRRVPFAVKLHTVEHVPDGAMFRISSLPSYAGLSAGLPLEAGTWLIDPLAAASLSLTVYSMQAEPNIVSIDLLDKDGELIASAHTLLSVSLAEAVVPVQKSRNTLIAQPAVAERIDEVPMVRPVAASSLAAVSASSRSKAQPAIKVSAPVTRRPPVVASKPRATATVRLAKAESRSAPRSAVRPSAPKPAEPQTAATILASSGKAETQNLSAPKERQPPPWASAWQRSALGVLSSGP